MRKEELIKESGEVLDSLRNGSDLVKKMLNYSIKNEELSKLSIEDKKLFNKVRNFEGKLEDLLPDGEFVVNYYEAVNKIINPIIAIPPALNKVIGLLQTSKTLSIEIISFFQYAIIDNNERHLAFIDTKEKKIFEGTELSNTDSLEEATQVIEDLAKQLYYEFIRISIKK